MTTDGGGWQICYTTRDKVRIANEVTYSYPYASHGYRSDCRNTVFNDVIALNHDNGQVAWFKQQSRSAFKFSSTNYFVTGSAFGLWTGFGAAATSSWSYQMGICDSASILAPGLWMSGSYPQWDLMETLICAGYTNCWKECNSWCGDTSTWYFRVESYYAGYYGVTWREQGHTDVSNKLVSYGIRQSA